MTTAGLPLSAVLDGRLLVLPLPARLASVIVTGVASDSRAVRPGDLFFAVPGTRTDGLAYAGAALAAGAVAVVAERAPAEPLDAPVLLVDGARGGVRRALARAAAAIHPAQPPRIAAITGTSGKTSVSVFLRQLLAAGGRSAVSLGTIGLVGPRGASHGSLTTPDPIALHRLLSELAAEGVTDLAMEASSHGLDQYRLDGVRLSATAFLNLSRDHLDYHPSMRAYFEAKMGLFQRLAPRGSPAVVAAAAPWRQEALRIARRVGLRPVTVGRRASDVTLARIAPEGAAQILDLRIGGARHSVRLPLVGQFQALNAASALALALALDVPLARALDGLARLEGVPGRLEAVGDRHGAPVLVDYAHKPEAMRAVLTTLRAAATGRLIVVFGCGGDRDAGKRPVMGQVAAELADVVIVTDDNPRSEAPAAIRRAILAGAPGAREIGDRAEAIRAAIAMLSPGDVLVIAGKGHEEGQIVGDRVLPFSDQAVARAALETLR